jgi:DNA-binding transcriptional LysR family regulator
VLIKQLEFAVGVSLFERNARMLRPTAAATEMLPRAERILDQLIGLASNAQTARDHMHERVSFAISAGLAPGLLPLILKAMQERHPRIVLAVQDVEPTQLIPRLLEEEVELSIGHIPHLGPELRVERLSAGQLAAIFPADGKLKRRTSMSWEELLTHPIIATPRGVSLRTAIDDTLAGHNMRIKPVYEPLLFATAVSLVANGLGVAIVPTYFAVEPHFPNLVSLPLVDPVINRDLMALTKAERPLSTAARLFIETAKSVLAALPRRGTRRRA